MPVGRASGKEREIVKNQFYQALCDFIKVRLLPEKEKELSQAVAVFDYCKTWPSELPLEYGVKELKFLCKRFSPAFSDIKQDFRDFKDDGGDLSSLVPKSNLKILMNAINTLPVSTAECERGFSPMNLVCTSLRSQLSVEHISSLMFLSLTGPPLVKWKPLPYVKSWLAKNRRDANHTACPMRKPRSVSETVGFVSLWKHL